MRRTVSFLLALTALLTTNARQISPLEAQDIASDFFSNGSSTNSKGAPARAVRTAASNQSESMPYYIFNAAGNGGFVIVSGDDRAKKILGYSDAGAFDFGNIPPQLDSLLNSYAKQIGAADRSAVSDVSSTASNVAATSSKLLKTAEWGQGYPYNLQTPEVDGRQSVTGCVATAMAIVMKYHNWPAEAFGENIYYSGNDYLRFDYNGLRFDWDSMTDTYGEESTEASRQAVASLMNAAGHSVEMEYSPYESGALVPYVGHALRYHFRYDEGCEYVHHSDYSDSEWKELLRHEIDEGRPVIYQGAGIGNHAFVCDGYTDDDLFHFNWGWDGIDNGYFALDALYPGGYDFSQDYSMVKGIKPDTDWKEFSQAYVENGFNIWGNERSSGATITTENVTAGEPFTFACNYMILPCGMSGKYGVAIVAADGTIKEILIEESFSIRNDMRDYRSVLCQGCIAKETPVEGDFVQLVTKDAKSDRWLLVKGVSTAPSKVPARGNVVKTSHVKIVQESPSGYFGQYSPGDHDIPLGMSVDFYISRQDLVGAGFPNHHAAVIVSHNGKNDYYFEREIEGQISNNVIIGEGDYTITLHSGPLSHKSATLTEAGTLSAKISPSQAVEASSLTVSGPLNITDIDYIQHAFNYTNCIDLSAATIEGKTIPSGLYSFNTKVETMLLPADLQKISSCAFMFSALSAVDIPASVTEIESAAFEGANQLTNVMVHWQNPIDIPYDAFNLAMTASNCTLYVPVGTSASYRAHEVWRNFANIIEKEDVDLSILNLSQGGVIYSLYNAGRTAVVSGFEPSLPARVTLPEQISLGDREYSVNKIADLAFMSSKLEYLEMPASIEALGVSSFFMNYNLKEVVLSPSLKEIPRGCFTYCYDLEKADLPEGIEYVDWGAFDTAKSLKSLHLPAKALLHPNGAYDGLGSCTSLTVDSSNPYYKAVDNILYTKDGTGLVLIAGALEGKVVIPEEVTQLPWRMFSHMPNLTEIEMPHHFEAVPYQFVWRCPKLKHVTLPDNATCTNTETVAECDALESITIGRKMEIAMGIHNNPSLKYVYLRNENALSIPNAFNGWYSAYNYYTDRTNNNVLLDDCNALYVPGECKEVFTSVSPEKIFELWTYKINRAQKQIFIWTANKDVVIDKVTINGKEYTADHYIFDIGDIENPDVVVDFTLHNRQAMTTHYTPEFNASLSDSTFPDLSGINDINTGSITFTTEPYAVTIHGAKAGTTVRLIDMSGRSIYSGSDTRIEVAHRGIYVLKINDSAYKIRL